MYIFRTVSFVLLVLGFYRHTHYPQTQYTSHQLHHKIPKEDNDAEEQSL